MGQITGVWSGKDRGKGMGRAGLPSRPLRSQTEPIDRLPGPPSRLTGGTKKFPLAAVRFRALFGSPPWLAGP